MRDNLLKDNLSKALNRVSDRDKIKSIALFGSELKGTARPDSDLDLLIEFKKPIGYFKLVKIQQTLEESLGRRVDLVTPGSLSKYFKKEVLNQAKVLYER
ncbi:MAG TPA: nucleotidyltransferase family protein [Patescibacteria group bacterium]|nr:nucleotidyltransferase family protein [Patescibacteria group bacterium]